MNYVVKSRDSKSDNIDGFLGGVDGASNLVSQRGGEL